MPDTPPRPLQVEPDALITLAEAARLTGRPIGSIRRWAHTGTLPVYQEDGGRRERYVSLTELTRVHVNSRQWGAKRPQERTLTTLNGKAVVFRGQVGMPQPNR